MASASPQPACAALAGQSLAAATSVLYMPLLHGGSAGGGGGETAANRPTLLASYLFRGNPDYNVGFQEYDVRYRPRQFITGLEYDTAERRTTVSDPGAYAGWDMLNTPNGGVSTIADRDDWLMLRLNRAATLAVVWQAGDPLPNWLKGWQRAGDVKLNGRAVPTFTRSFPAGLVELGSVYDPGQAQGSRPTYLVLFAEADGSPCAPPSPPPGRTLPAPNMPCPAWVHDSYLAQGPDGKSYPTWHPQVDPVYWCYFDHEHGSDPGLFSAGYRPAYGYASQAAGMLEPHPGFKSYAFDDGEGHLWLMTHHFGSGSLGRACVRFHSLDIAVADKASGELLADLHFMGDFGKSVAASADASDLPLTPPDCPDQALLAEQDGSSGVRKIKVADRDLSGYEPWRLDGRNNLLGLNAAGLTFATRNPMVTCNTLLCDSPFRTSDAGEIRFLTAHEGFGLQAGANSGVFYTDPTGRQLRAAGDLGALKQFIKPGLLLTPEKLHGHGVQSEPWRMPYVFTDHQTTNEYMVIEGALTGAN